MRVELENIVTVDILTIINFVMKTVKKATTLSELHAILKEEKFNQVKIYKGGAHIAVIDTRTQERILLITE